MELKEMIKVVHEWEITSSSSVASGSNISLLAMFCSTV